MKEERKVKEEDGKIMAEEFGFPFNETSAREGININETFEDLVERIDSVYSKLDININKTKKNKLYKGKAKSSCC